MSLPGIALAYVALVFGASSDEGGLIRGRVVNLSQGESPCAGAEVILRARVENEFAPVAQTVADADGHYRFEGLPVGPEYLYLPGANHREIHYPGRRVSLTRGQPAAYVTLDVWDTVAEPSPLVIRRHEIVIGTEAGVVHVVEAMLVDNPAHATYVGWAPSDDAPPITLRLNVPSDFERITFEQEKFGREFRVFDGRLETGIPWTPGQHWLRFTYTLRPESVRRGWQRPLDAPSDSIRVRVKHSRPDEIVCNLPPAAEDSAGERGFQSAAGVLPAGYVLRVQPGHVPVPWSAYARWSALFALAGLIVGTAFHLRRSSRTPPSDAGAAAAGHEEASPAPLRGKARIATGRTTRGTAIVQAVSTRCAD
jgi:hypothetical protein